MPDIPKFFWFNKTDGSWYERITDTWEKTTESSRAIGDINFMGTVSADGDEGLTGQRTLGGYTLTCKKGLLVGFEAV